MKAAIIALGLLMLAAQTSQTTHYVTQLPMPANARPVSTLTNGKITTWTTGIDGDGKGDGYLTLSAASFNGDKAPHALPDSSLIPANEQHPAIKLHYDNADEQHNQTYNIAGEDSVKFIFRDRKCKTIYLALTSSEGPSDISVTFNHKFAPAITKNFVVPDYYDDIKPDNPDFCYLVHDLAKWGPKNNMTEKDHHNIDLLKIDVSHQTYIRSITIKKGKRGYLVLWAAAAV
ncbi:MAG TPA: hypothetical protein VIM55_06915 [Mucilaginibacter sp.]